MTVSTHEALLDRLKSSQILSADELQKAIGLVSDQDDSKAAARKLVAAGLITRWQAGQLLKPGKTTLALGKYVLLDRLPWGSSHAVFLAKHPTMDRKVALNVLDKTSSARSDAVKSFLADARAIAALDHRHLIHVYDIDEAENRYFLVMEHVEGRHLHDTVKASGKLSIEKAADIVRQIADGLDHAHSNKLIHGGLRPTNVLLDGQGVVKIIDLGVSKFDDPTKPPANAGNDSQVMESANFLSPEQATGGPATAQSDLYSLGCIGYVLLTGKLPFGQGDYATRLANHQSEAPPDVRMLRKDTPDGLAEILLKLMARSPNDRFGSAKEVVEAIESWWSQYAAQLEAAKPKPKAKPPLAKGAAPVSASKPAPVVAAKPAPAKPAPGKAAPAPARPASADADEVAFPGIQLKGAKAPAKPAAKLPAARPAAAAQAGDTSESAATIPAFMAPQGKKSPPALPTKKTGRSGSTKILADAPATDPSPTPLAKKSSNKPLLLAAVGGAVVLLLLLVGAGIGAYFLLSDSSTKDVVVNTPDATETASEEGDKPEGDADAPPREEPADKSTDDDPANEGGNGEEGNGDSPPATTSDPPAEEPVEPEPPADPKATDPAPTEPEAPAATPQPKPPKEPPQAKPADPFTALAKAISLPSPKEEQKSPTALGAVAIPAESTCYIDLVGGDKAVPKEGVTISMEPARGGLATRDWEIKLAGTPRGDINIATLALSDKELMFQWTPDAAKIEEAGYLVNCQLNLRTADHEFYLMLRQPQEVPAIAVNLSRAQMREKFEIPFAPHPESIMIEVIKVEGAENASIAPKNLLTAKQDTTFVWFGDGGDRILGLKVDAMMQKDLQLAVTPVLNDPNSGPTKFVAKQVAALKSRMIAGASQLNTRLQQMKASPNKAQLANAITAAEVQLAEATKALEAFDKLEEQFVAVNGKASVQFRIYYTDGNHQVDLVRGMQGDEAVGPELPAGDGVPKLDLDGDGQ